MGVIIPEKMDIYELNQYVMNISGATTYTHPESPAQASWNQFSRITERFPTCNGPAVVARYKA